MCWGKHWGTRRHFPTIWIIDVAVVSTLFPTSTLHFCLVSNWMTSMMSFLYRSLRGKYGNKAQGIQPGRPSLSLSLKDNANILELVGKQAWLTQCKCLDCLGGSITPDSTVWLSHHTALTTILWCTELMVHLLWIKTATAAAAGVSRHQCGPIHWFSSKNQLISRKPRTGTSANNKRELWKLPVEIIWPAAFLCLLMLLLVYVMPDVTIAY